jgi:hypothetical protein
MKTLIQIIFVKTLAGIAKKSQNAYDMRLAQTIAHVTNKDGIVEPLVGELVLPAELKETPPGHYLVDFRLSVSQQKRIESVVHSLTPCDAKGNPVQPAAQKQVA